MALRLKGLVIIDSEQENFALMRAACRESCILYTYSFTGIMQKRIEGDTMVNERAFII